jgi:hypothetical protein
MPFAPTHRARLCHVAGLAAAVAAVSGLLAPSALAETFNPDFDTYLLSRSTSNGLPNGPSTNATVSQDERIASVIGFQSNASNLVSGDRNGSTTDIFTIRRQTPRDLDSGEPWRLGAKKLITRSPSGAAANGPSHLPAVGGSPDDAPRCIAFVSRASNLVSGDTNGKPDAFVANLSSGAIQRVSVSSSERQSNGSTFDVAVNGGCNRVAFTSDASNLHYTGSIKPALRTTGPPSGSRQVYVRTFASGGDNSGLTGYTFMASARSGRAGNRSSFDPAMSARRGDSVAYASQATNLSGGDTNTREDVYLRPMRRSSSDGGTLVGDSLLASRNGAGRAGNGRSLSPAISGATQFSTTGVRVAFQTLATDIARNLPDGNGTWDIVRLNVKDNTRNYASNGENKSVLGNGPATDPAMTEAGSWVFHASTASNYNAANGTYNRDGNGSISDTFVWSENRRPPPGGALLVSKDSARQALRMPSTNPATSARGNYSPFETRDPYADRELFARSWPNSSPSEMRARAAQEARFHQVYLEYLGPK